MGNQFTVHVETVFFDRGAQSRNIDRNVNDAEEGQGEHARDRACEGWDINTSEFWQTSQRAILIMCVQGSY